MTEHELIQGCKKGRRDAQEALYTTFLPYLLTIARRYGIPSEDEADVIHEIFIEVFTNVHRYKSRKGTAKSWIRSIAVHKILNLKRKSMRDYKMYSSGIEPGIQSNAIDYQQHEPTYILKAIEALPEGYRMVFNLYEVDGYSHTEIAKMLDITEVGSRSQLSRARAALRKALKNQTDYGATR